jgi:soluble lytic murein transglycosylase-like protein
MGLWNPTQGSPGWAILPHGETREFSLDSSHGLRQLWASGKRAAALAALLLAVAPGEPALAGAAIYSFVGPDGVIHFTDTPRDARYRKLPDLRPGAVPRLRAPQRAEYDGLIGLTAREHEVEPALVKAVIAAESNFDPEAVSRKGAQGLMQLMPVTATDLGVEDPLRPTENVRGGTRYLRLMIDRYGDLERALAAYNAGPAAVDRYGGIPPYRETQDYVRRVLTYYRHYHGDFAP